MKNRNEEQKVPNQISQPKSNEALDTDFDPVQDRKDELLFDALEDELRKHQEECFHTADMLEPIDLEDCGDEIIRVCKCHCCGEIIKELFTSNGIDLTE